MAAAAGAAAHSIIGDDVQAWKGQHVLSVRQFDVRTLRCLFGVASRMKALVQSTGGCDMLKHRVMTAAFYEASTRTSCSFQAAMLRLGGQVMTIDSKSSSVSKGETLADTVRCLECYSDVIVLRHPVKGSAKEAADAASVPILNAGDGTGEHPTQSLLDTFTIFDELAVDDIAGKTITLCGDLKHGRTVHSLAQMLALFDDVTIRLVSPGVLAMPQEVVEAASAAGATVTVHESLVDELASGQTVLADSDIVYMTRLQRERFPKTPEGLAEYEATKGSFVLNAALLEQTGAKSSLRILHPLPRVDEIATDVDSDPRAAYFRQMKNGLFVRMALLALCLGGDLALLPSL